jgi:multisubunit Na+/H+ antiporter MnhG subunit
VGLCPVVCVSRTLFGCNLCIVPRQFFGFNLGLSLLLLALALLLLPFAAPLLARGVVRDNGWFSVAQTQVHAVWLCAHTTDLK